jgi:hypothetical protein
MKNLKLTLGLRNDVAQFNNRINAFGWANHCIKSHVVMLGDNDKYWVVCFSDAQRLSKLGYEVAM